MKTLFKILFSIATVAFFYYVSVWALEYNPTMILLDLFGAMILCALWIDHLSDKISDALSKIN